LISTASLVGYLALSHLIQTYNVEGTIQLLGTPAEEGGGGKIELLKAGAYKDVDVSLMAHPLPVADDGSVQYPGGCAGVRTNAKQGLSATFIGKSAHAGAEPWHGINALDALVTAYNNVSMLRQQMHPSCRVHSAIVEAPKVANIIPERTKAAYSVRATSLGAAVELTNRVEACIHAGALATGCSCSIDREEPYAELRPVRSLCEAYTSHMKLFGKDVEVMATEILGASTDQGNVSQEMPALHPMFGISCKPGINIHSAEFAEVAGTKEAFDMAVVVGKALALTGWNLLTQNELFFGAKRDFEEGK
jgi:amidohydrolase